MWPKRLKVIKGIVCVCVCVCDFTHISYDQVHFFVHKRIRFLLRSIDAIQQAPEVQEIRKALYPVLFISAAAKVIS